MSTRHPPVTVHDADDEDDIDDLDDVISQFKPAPARPPPPVAQGPPRPPPNTAAATFSAPADTLGTALPDALGDDFARELARGMESLMRELGQPPGPEGAGAELTEEAEEAERMFKAAWEAMLVEGMDGTAVEGLGKALDEKSVPASGVGAGVETSGTAGKDDFRKGIKQAMGKLKESESNLKADSANAPADPMEALLAQLSSLSGEGDGAEGEPNEEELAGLLENMMGQLMSRDVLEEPLRELYDKFPPYLATTGLTLPPSTKGRYESQFTIVQQIIAVFDDPKYDEGRSGAKVAALMSEMQEFGSPPPEIMGPLPPGFAMGADGLPQLGEGCAIM